MHTELQIGDLVVFKKSHPSGTIKWELIRIGALYKFKSTDKFDLFIELRRSVLDKQIKQIIKKEGE
ncbi:hypothetical protein mflW37_7070 [Mesoplasma florum W37]|uniref:Protein involved in chromosome partitioning n=1 Tax=Mesoplasma florum TaxID=2151 RepID=A0A2R3P6C7_MESFO|nr:DUF951 domain-containing protein [Mesoplasma florum]AGY41774.1 hypothetical protein mflW37_7070 [Mesoplasma florum W37]AVN59974.1 DUF951 domain-containing protein [Mesoplasma florum]AVN64024.1 DUF951 domain-containing protein [Mesoplasma florum]AVN65369.1 DUF951 domain-containing protein [Mesoplasma florum]AVN66113.1 protein involved in chromosome partitioning [Mesoplasma florum]